MPKTKTGRNRTTRSTSKSLPLDKLMGLLAGDVRRSILLELGNGPAEVTPLAELVDAEISVVSHNLRRLREAGLVNQKRQSRQRIYSLSGKVKRSKRGRKITLTFGAEQGAAVAITA